MSTRPARGLFPGPEGWWLAPEGAAIHLEAETAVIADVHLGYEWARASTGDVVPAHSLPETLAKLGRLLDRAAIRHLIVAGDLVESFGPCPRTARDLEALGGWLAERGVEPRPIQGDHDRRPGWPETVEVRGWTVAHGSRPVAAERRITGHLHPILRAEGRSFPCVLAGPTWLVLPAFSENAAGLDVGRASLPAAVERLDGRCVAAVAEEWLDFGSLRDLRATLLGPINRSSGSRATRRSPGPR
jgi:hypothetical protein